MWYRGLLVVTLGAALCTWSSLASAQATRTWVSGVGDDANPCSRTAPCKTFAGAISKTAAGGEIDCLDPGGFGAVTIVKSITIDCGTVTGGILAAGTNGVIVNAGVNDRIILRNLVINGVGSGLNGIRFLAGRELVVEHVVIQQFTGNGIDISAAATARLVVKDVSIFASAVGIKSTTTAGTISGTLEDVLIADMSTHGVQAVSNTALAIKNLASVRNLGDGVLAEGGTVTLIVEDSVSHGNNFGFRAAAGNIRLHNSLMSFNNTNLNAAVRSDGTNRSTDNTTTNSPSPNAFTVQ